MNRLKCLPTNLSLTRSQSVCAPCNNPMHLICFKQWTSEMVDDIISSAINLKFSLWDTHFKKLNVLKNAKVMLLQEINEPTLNLAVSKAASLLGATDVSINDKLIWEYDYVGRVFSMMCDIIFVSTSTHGCVARFAEQSSVPVMCIRSRAHASLQALATIMTIIEEYGSMNYLNVAYIGTPHPVLNSYLLLCPMLGANLRFKCCCEKCPVSPLLYKVSENMTEKSHTTMKQCKHKDDVLYQACVVIAGPATNNEEKIKEFKFGVQDIKRCNNISKWIFFHTLPRGSEIDDELFMHNNARTFNAFNNMQYIAAALMAKALQGHVF
ncbi:PREDICTED: ornithine carbamoyltransferase-like isoform X1 [Papilio polytes]|uniref:ornithine carbamoyltransferase-like isoform X1 n=1 Tax=Papilio polytes TaxID=76194 RepID=UPI0006769A54|nr:PREDICTED: ornithine carbamoyltransferase-like isoform X1 [Papilio polytes]